MRNMQRILPSCSTFTMIGLTGSSTRLSAPPLLRLERNLSSTIWSKISWAARVTWLFVWRLPAWLEKNTDSASKYSRGITSRLRNIRLTETTTCGSRSSLGTLTNADSMTGSYLNCPQEAATTKSAKSLISLITGLNSILRLSARGYTQWGQSKAELLRIRRQPANSKYMKSIWTPCLRTKGRNACLTSEML